MLNKFKILSIVVVCLLILGVRFIQITYPSNWLEYISAIIMILLPCLSFYETLKDKNYQFAILGKANNIWNQANINIISSTDSNTGNEAIFEALRLSEEKYRNIFENSPFPNFIFDMESYKILDVNNAAIEKYGYIREEFLKLTLDNVRSKREKSSIKELANYVAKNNLTHYRGNAWHVKKDGSEMFMDVCTYFTIENGRKTGNSQVNDITEKKIAEEALFISEEKYRNVFEKSPFPKFIFELEEYRIIDVNNTAIEKYGYTKEEFLELTLDQIRSAKEKSRIKDFAEYIKKNNLATFRGQSWHVKKNGAEMFMDVNIYFTIDGGKKVGHAQINEITEKKKTEEALLQSEALLKAVIENTNDAVCTADVNGIIQTVNTAHQNFFYSLRQVWVERGMSLFDDLEEEKKPLVIENFNKVLAGETIKYDRDYILNDKHVYYEVSINPIIMPSGEIIGVSYFRHDITERKLAEIEIKENEGKYRKLIETMHEGLLYVDNDDNVQFANDYFAALTGYSREELKGQLPLKILVDEGTREKILEKSKLRLRGISDDYEVQIIRKNGEKIWALVSGSPLYNDQNEVIGTIATFIDITERKNAENKLLAKNRELDEFAYIVSHDLKAPLRAINNLSEWIEEDLGDKLTLETKQNMDLMRSRVKRMEMLINGILEYSRIGRNTTIVERIEINHFLADIMEMLSPPEMFNIEIKADNFSFHAEKIKLQQVFSNLISNAIKHHEREDGSLTICAKKFEEYCEFSVEDDGPGIDPRFHEKIFVIFQTLKPKDTVESTGIGLTIVKKIIEENGGSIRLESQVGKGTKFIFTWFTQKAGEENDIEMHNPQKTSLID